MTDYTSPMGAVISPCGTWRYHLWRRWERGAGTLLWCMLNPSTADAMVNDPTIGRVISYSRRWGYAGAHVVNLFNLRATDPQEILAESSLLRLLGPDGFGMQHIVESVMATGATQVVCGWGAKGSHLGQDSRTLAALRALGATPYALGLNRDGTPVHPLYQPSMAERVAL